MKFLVPLGLAALVLAAALVAWRRGPAGEPVLRKSAAPETEAAPAPPPPPYPVLLASEIIARMDALRVRSDLHKAYQTAATPEEKKRNEALRQEIAALGDSLADHLLEHPELWPDVIRRLSEVESPLVMLEIASRLTSVADEPQDVLLRELMQTGKTPLARRTAVALLAESPSPASLHTFAETCQRDPDSQVRYDAFIQVVRRKQDPAFEAFAPSLDEVIRRQCAVETDVFIRESMAVHLPGSAPTQSPVKPRHKGGAKRPGAKSR